MRLVEIFDDRQRLEQDRSFAVDQGASEPAAAALEHEFKLDQYYRYQLERPTNRGEDEPHAAVPLSLLPTFLATTVIICCLLFHARGMKRFV